VFVSCAKACTSDLSQFDYHYGSDVNNNNNNNNNNGGGGSKSIAFGGDPTRFQVGDRVEVSIKR